MQNLIFVLIIVLATSLSSKALEPTAYEKKMTEALKKLNESKSVADYIEAANQFAVIGKVTKDEWLPWYYYANTYILLTYIDYSASMKKKDQYLDLAEPAIARMLEQFPKESELHVLNGFCIVSRIAIDSGSRGVSLYPGYAKAIDKSVEINPANPRAKFFKLSNDIGTAQYMGQNVKSFCPRLQELLNGWDDYKNPSALHPTWGKGEVEKKFKELCK